MNWQMSLSRNEDIDSSLCAFESSDSFSSDSNYSKFFSTDTTSSSDTNSTVTEKSSELEINSRNDDFSNKMGKFNVNFFR